MLDQIIEEVDRMGPRLGNIVLLTAENPLDPTTPLKVPLVIVAWGRGKRGGSYDLRGWEDIGENEEYVVVKGANPYGTTTKHHLMLTDDIDDKEYFVEFGTLLKALKEWLPDWEDAYSDRY